MTRAPLVESLRSIVHAVEITGPGTFTVGGQPGRPVDPAAEAGFAAQPSRNPVVGGLLQAVYHRWYCQTGGPEPVEPSHDQDLFPALSAANAGRDRWEPGWQIASVEADGKITAVKAGRSLTAQPGEYATQGGPGLPPRVGAPVSLHAPRESLEYQQGFYFAFGETLGGRADQTAWVRFYWHLRPAGAVPLVAGLTSRLNRYQVPFRLKVLQRSSMYRRPDAGVLFVARHHYQVAAALSAETHAEIVETLRPGVNLFVKRLAPGLGLAEDPGTGESFGWHRSRLVAEALWRAWRQGVTDPEQRLAILVAHLEAHGVDLARPYLCRSRVDLYDFPTSRSEDHAA